MVLGKLKSTSKSDFIFNADEFEEFSESVKIIRFDPNLVECADDLCYV